MRRNRTVITSCLSVLTLWPLAGCDDAQPRPQDATPGDTREEDSHTPDAEVEVEVADKPGLGIDYDSTGPGARPRLELGASDWMSVGWPSDRFNNNGRITLKNMPYGVASLLDTYMDFGEEVLDGFGLNGAIYFELDQALDPTSLPAVTDTTRSDSIIQLVHASDGPRFGERLPLVFRFYDGASRDPLYRPNTLAMRPVYGFPLAEGATYCAIVTRAVKDAQGRYLQQAAELSTALDAPFLAPLQAALDASPLAVRDLATASCFTTQRATRELNLVARYIDAAVPPALDLIYEPNVFGEFHGLYHAPNFQAGAKPYATEGGDIRFEGDQPLPQEDEALRFLLLTPTDHLMPEAGWPVTLYSHGTGGDYESCRNDTRELVQDGVAVLCIDQPLHGPRGPGRELDETELVLYNFNFINPASGRSAFRQAAIDTLWLTRMIEAGRFDLPAAATRARQELRLDPDRILFFGHSHGGLSGTLAIGVDSRIKAAVISGMSGVLIETILRRKDPADLANLAAALLGIVPAELDTFHPALNLMQMLVDTTDPITYTPLWLNPPAGVPPKHVFVTEGTLDHASPAIGTDAAAAAGHVPLVRPLAHASEPHALRGLEPVDLPLSDNVDLGGGVRRTVALRQWQGASHFVAFRAADARAMWRRFLVSAAYEDSPELSTGSVAVPQAAPTVAAERCEDALAAAPIDTSRGFPIEVRGNTRLASNTASACAETPELGQTGRDLHYRLVAPATGAYRLRIDLPAAANNTPRNGPTVISALDGCGTCLGAARAQALDLDLSEGQDIVVAVDGADWQDAGPFTLVIEQRCALLECGERECGAWGCGSCGTCGAGNTCSDGRCVPRPVGDSCQAPIDVPGLPFSWSGDTRTFWNTVSYGATDCPDFPHAYGAASSDVIFRFVPPVSGRYLARADADFDVNLWASTSCSDAGDECLGAVRTGGRKVTLPLELSAGVPIYVFVDGASNTGNSAGHATLELTTCTPRCDGRDCGDDGCGGSCGACEGGESCVVTPGSCVIPYECPATAACARIEGDLCASALPVGPLPFTDQRSTAAFHNDYGYGGHWCPAQPDGSGSRDSRGFGSADVAYAFTAPRAGLYRFGLDTQAGGPVFDAALYLASDCSDIEATCLGADERERNERVWAELEADQTVYAIVDGWSNVSNLTGTYRLEVRECVPSCAGRACGSDGCAGHCGECGEGLVCQSGQCRVPTGTTCSAPRRVGSLPWSETLDTSTFGADRDGCDGGGAASPDITWRFVAPRAATFRFALRADFPARLIVEDGCAGNSCLGESTDAVDLALEAGEVVFVTADGVDADGPVSGRVTLTISEPCVPDCEGRACGDDGCGGSCGACALPADLCTADYTCVDPHQLTGNTCESARTVGALPFSARGDTRGQTNDYFVDEGGCGGFSAKGVASADEVWRFTAPTAGRYIAELATDGFAAVLYALSTCAGPVTTCIALDDGERGERLTLDLLAGESVFIVVDGEGNVQDNTGPYELTLYSAH